MCKILLEFRLLANFKARSLLTFRSVVLCPDTRLGLGLAVHKFSTSLTLVVFDNLFRVEYVCLKSRKVLYCETKVERGFMWILLCSGICLGSLPWYLWMGFKVLYEGRALVFSELHKFVLLPLHTFVQSQQFTAFFCFHADSLYNAHFSYPCAYSKWGVFSIFTELLLALPTIHLRAHNNCCTLLSEMAI